MSITSRYEQTISTFLNCLSVTFFVILILLLLELLPNISGVIILPIVVASSVLVLKSFYSERRCEIFDLSSPTFFETGLLVFQSPMNRCAIFFAYKITMANFKNPSFKRMLTILLKILPASTILALEWTSQRECFITFFMRLNKTSFLTQTREVLDHINKGFASTLGAQCAQLLNGDELMVHFSMGIPGRFQKISVDGRQAVNITTDMTYVKASIAILSPLGIDTFSTILNKLNKIQNCRIIFSIKKTENATKINKSLNLVVSGTAKKKIVQMLHSDSITISQIPATESMQVFGDVLSRNQIQAPKIEMDFPETASLVIDLLSTPWPPRKEPGLSLKDEQDSVTEVSNALIWRELLVNQFLDLNLSYQKDVVLLIEGLPLRIDALVDDFFFFIIPNVKDSHLQWLIQKITTLLDNDEKKSAILLLTQPPKSTQAPSILSNLPQAGQIHLVRNKQELVTLLKEKKPDLWKKQISQVAQKAL
jgi:hypothetical protein